MNFKLKKSEDSSPLHEICQERSESISNDFWVDACMEEVEEASMNAAIGDMDKLVLNNDIPNWEFQKDEYLNDPLFSEMLFEESQKHPSIDEDPCRFGSPKDEADRVYVIHQPLLTSKKTRDNSLYLEESGPGKEIFFSKTSKEEVIQNAQKDENCPDFHDDSNSDRINEEEKDSSLAKLTESAKPQGELITTMVKEEVTDMKRQDVPDMTRKEVSTTSAPDMPALGKFDMTREQALELLHKACINGEDTFDNQTPERSQGRPENKYPNDEETLQKLYKESLKPMIKVFIKNMHGRPDSL
ncbi:unnamed protein product [Moneuplotes crassus]|uniref:Uncharacterized protein n=1 Tax=Euplotes crassus TaxID=5936 RepID=A0AAD1X8H2_EUPCR|nr:unnamed protein product [Moneuplotes crassus]